MGARGSEQFILRRRGGADVDLVGLYVRLASTRHGSVEDHGEGSGAEDALDPAVAGDGVSEPHLDAVSHPESASGDRVLHHPLNPRA